MNSNHNQLKFSVLSPEYYNSRLDDLLKLALNEVDPKAVMEHINEFFDGRFIFCMCNNDNQELYVYRVVSYNMTDSQKRLPSSFSYNPLPDIGRANLKNKPVFYASFSEGTALKEVQLDSGNECYISKWRLNLPAGKNIATLAFGNEFPEGSFSRKFADLANQNVENWIAQLDSKQKEWFLKKNELFCKLFTLDSDKYYPISSAIANDLFEEFEDKGANISAIYYPSIAEKSSVNIAIKKGEADNPDLLQLVSVLKLEKVVKDTEAFTFCVSEEGIPENGIIKWKRAYTRKINCNFDLVHVKFESENEHLRERAENLIVGIGGIRNTLSDYLNQNRGLITQYVNQEVMGSNANTDMFEPINIGNQNYLGIIPLEEYYAIHEGTRKNIEYVIFNVSIDFK